MLLAHLKNNVVKDVNVLKTMFRVLSFANVNVFLSRNLSPCKIQAFSHSFLVRKFSSTDSVHRFCGNSPKILRKLFIYRTFPGKYMESPVFQKALPI